MEYRRRGERQPAAWAGFCHIAGEFPSMWRDCEVIDVSMFGLGITLHHPQPWELVHRRILVDVFAIGDDEKIRLEGQIKDAAFTLEGDIRIGLEFTGLSRTSEAITAILSDMRAMGRSTAAAGMVR